VLPYSFCSPISVTANCTDLGVSYDVTLSFTPRINKIVTKASCRAKLVLKCSSSRDPQLLTRSFRAFVRPLFEFSSVIVSPKTLSDINRFESVQRSFANAINYLSFPT
jgi:hypothetical protein